MTEQTMDQTMAQSGDPRRKGVKRTVTILASIALAFFLLSFLQIMLMK